MRRSFVSLVLLVSMTACAPKQAPVATAPAAPPAAATATPAAPDSVRWVRGAAEYQAALYQVYRLATARVEQAAAARPQGSWAVVLDADEP